MTNPERKAEFVEAASRGLFITFEGLDGSGKTTQLRLLGERLRVEGYSIVETVEPGGTEIGRHIRRVLLDPANVAMAPITELLLYFAARTQNLEEVIVPALRRGAVVLSDRYTDSSLAYQGAARGLGEDVVLLLHEVACAGLHPHLTVYVEIDEETSLARARNRNRRLPLDGCTPETRLDEEADEFHRKVRLAFDRLAAQWQARYRRVDGRGTPEEVAARVWSAVTPALDAAALLERQGRHV